MKSVDSLKKQIESAQAVKGEVETELTEEKKKSNNLEVQLKHMKTDVDYKLGSK